MKNVAGKMRRPENAYAHWTDPATGWEYWLLKSWQGDNSKPYSRWLLKVNGFGSDMGDTYCDEARGSLNRAMGSDYDDNNANFSFDHTVWSYGGEFAAWAWGEK